MLKIKKSKHKKAFTLIELLIIVAIIALLATIAIISWAISAQKKAAISSYKTSMNSVSTAVEMCVGTGGTVQGNGGTPSGTICDQSSYPTITAKCGEAPYFCVSGTATNWEVTTATSSDCNTPWYCKGCNLVCSVSGCEKHEENPGDCF